MTVTRMSVFEAFRGKEQISAAEIAAEVEADRLLLGKDPATFKKLMNNRV